MRHASKACRIFCGVNFQVARTNWKFDGLRHLKASWLLGHKTQSFNRCARPKIICTLGPATEKTEILRQLIQKGLRVVKWQQNARTPCPRVLKRGYWSSLSFHRQLDVDRALLFAERAAQLRQRDILQLTNPLARDAEFLAHFFERLRFAAV
jgi:Pyruvate kinase